MYVRRLGVSDSVVFFHLIASNEARFSMTVSLAVAGTPRLAAMMVSAQRGPDS